MVNANKRAKRNRRHGKVTTAIRGKKTDLSRPRLCVYKSNTRIYAQIIDDKKGNTLFAISDSTIKSEKGEKKNSFKKVERAQKAGIELAKEAVAKKVTKVVFDRGGFKYTGRVKAFAEGAREGGLVF